MRTLRFTIEDVSRGNLILVNPSHPIKTDIPLKGLVPIRPKCPNLVLEQQPARMLSEIMRFLGCEQEIVPVSGYRTMQEQQQIYANSLLEHGEAFTRKYVAIPGCSEHQTGLAIDLAQNSEAIDFIRPDFSYTGICGLFREFSAQYGFIERYPADREHITAIAHEPWHFRYVGYPHSEIVQEKSFTLEDYTGYLKQFPYVGDHFYFSRNRRDFEIFYVPISHSGEAIIEIADDIPYQVSGNNMDGVIITLWREQR